MKQLICLANSMMTDPRVVNGFKSLTSDVTNSSWGSFIVDYRQA
jgi:hypothetical protein